MHRFQLVSRQERLSRNKKKRAAPGALASGKTAHGANLTSGPQLDSDAGRLGAVTNAKKANAQLSAKGTAAREPGVATAEPGAARRWEELALGSRTALGDDTEAEANTARDAYDAPDREAPGGEAERARDSSALDVPADTKGYAKKRRRRPTRPSANSVATRLLLPVLAAEWEERVAAFKARNGVPPQPYRPTDFEEAFRLTAGERRALHKDQIRHLNTTARKIVSRALGSVEFIDRWRDAIAQMPVDVRLIDLIDTLARALSHADALLSTTYEVALPEYLQTGEMIALTPQQRLELLVQTARAARRGLLKEVKRLIDRGRVPRGVLSGLKGRAGHYHAGTDVLALLNVLEGAIAVGTPVTFTSEELKRYTAVAYELIQATAHAPGRRGGAARAAAIEERSRAFTLLWLAHREAYWGLAGIFRDRLDVNVVLPSLVG